MRQERQEKVWGVRGGITGRRRRRQEEKATAGAGKGLRQGEWKEGGGENPGEKAGAAALGKGAGRERPVLGARNGPRMDEDPVGPRHRVAGGPVGYKHGMRNGMGPQDSPGD